MSASLLRGPRSVLDRLYYWVMGLAGRKNAVWALAAIAFVESSVFPIPPDIMLIPMVLAARAKAWRLALICTISSVIGGIAGYAIGYYLYESVGRPLLAFYNAADAFAEFRHIYAEWGGWAVFIAGVTPFPYKVITIASGVFQLDPTTFIIASVLARGLRFFLVAALLWWMGPPIRDFIEKRLALMFTLFVVLLLGGFVVAKFLA